MLLLHRRELCTIRKLKIRERKKSVESDYIIDETSNKSAKMLPCLTLLINLPLYFEYLHFF